MFLTKYINICSLHKCNHMELFELDNYKKIDKTKYHSIDNINKILDQNYSPDNFDTPLLIENNPLFDEYILRIKEIQKILDPSK